LIEAPKNELLGKRRLLKRRTVITALGLALIIAFSCFCTQRRIRRFLFWATQWQDRGAIVFLGDSILAGWDDLSSAFPGCKVANRALIGDRTNEVLRRLKTDVLPLKPSGLVLLIGTNDLNEGAEPEAVLENIKLIVSLVRQSSMIQRTIVCTLTPRAHVAGRFPEQILKLNEGLKKAFGNDPGSSVFDSWSLFADEHGQPRQDDFPDLLHPSPSAYQKWAAALRPLLSSQPLAPIPVTNK
jgi:lysophospholipase L1-like esterase